MYNPEVGSLGITTAKAWAWINKMKYALDTFGKTPKQIYLRTRQLRKQRRPRGRWSR